MTLDAIVACVVGAVLGVWIEWRRPAPSRTSRVFAVLAVTGALAVLAWRPTRSVPGITAVTLNTNSAAGRSFAAVEATASRLAPDASIRLTGDGLAADAVRLLRPWRMQWDPPRDHVGLAALRWPHRAFVGDRIAIAGVVDTRDSAWITLTHPDGARDSIRTDSAFTFRTTLKSAGAWSWTIASTTTDTIGIDVLTPPRPRLVFVEGRPGREGAALGRLATAQGGWLLQRTRVSASDDRVVRHGPAPLGRELTSRLLDSVDAVVLGPGASSALTTGERAAIAAAMRSGLGVVHLVDSAMPSSPLRPFAVQAAPGEPRVKVRIDDRLTAQTAIPVAPVTLHAGDVLLRTDSDIPLAWRVSSGGGVAIVTRLTMPSRLALAGEAGVEAAWWATLLGAAMRPPTAEWRIDDDALARVDHPLAITRAGSRSSGFVIVEPAQGPERSSTITQPDSALRQVVLWPRATGWLAVIDGADTLRVLVAGDGGYPSIDREMRRAATRAAVAGRPAPPARQPPATREPVPLWWAWAVLVAALTWLWRPR